MTYRFIFLLGTGVVAAAVLGYFSWAAKAAPGATRPSPSVTLDRPAPVQAQGNDAAEVARLQDELGNLRGQMKDVRSQLSMVQADLNQRKPAADDQAPALTHEEQVAQVAERRREHMAEVATAFAREQRDAAWADSVTEFVEGKLHSEPALSGASKVECRASTCRFQIDRDETGDTDKQLQLFLHSLGQTLSSSEADYQVNNGKGRYTFFLKDQSRAPASPGAQAR